MKKLLFFVAIVATLQANAKIWRVNSNPALNADAQQGGTLFDNQPVSTTNPEAAAGDTIYFEPSATDYSGFTVNEANIVLMGYGYFLAQNTGKQAMPDNVVIGSVTLGPNAAGSKVYGLEFSSQIIFNNVANVLASRCKTAYVDIQGYNANASGIRIDKCYVSYQLRQYSNTAGIAANIQVENCIFSETTNTGAAGISLSSNTVKGLIRNCIFNNFGAIYCFNFYFANNIFIGASDFGSSNTQSGSNIFRNNMFSYPLTNTSINPPTNSQITNTGANSGNVYGQLMTAIFVGTPSNPAANGTTTFHDRINVNVTGSDVESRFDFAAGSGTLVNIGENGTTQGGATVTGPAIGAYGATDPYRKGGFPPIPRITGLTIPPTVANGAGTMTISVSSSSNN